ncbi:MAG: pyrimidine dimer DNA glycosylase/endonuclease V [Candidatus Roizmanbacteria bacterium]
MRIWDISPSFLCRKHLLGEHRELHAIWSVITQNKKGYSKHPETIRWVGKLKALHMRHQELVNEMKKRGYTHASDLPARYARGKAHQDVFIHSIDEQVAILKQKGCLCFSVIPKK